MSLSNNVFKQLEPDEDVPENLRKELISEIDMMRDSMSVFSLFISHFFDVALMAFTDFNKKDSQSSDS
jgi:ABC-type sulfate/molybdate transport systems ATPase subunit